MILILSACTTSLNRAIIGSFEDITSGRHIESGTFAQVHAASINGLLPFDTVGESYFFDNKRGMLSAIGVSSVNPEGSNVPFQTITYTITRDYPSDATLDDLVVIRNGITESSARIIRALRAERAYRTAAGKDEVAEKELHREWTNAVAQADVTLTELNKATSKRNLLVFRWNTASQGSASLKAGGLFGAKAAKNSDQAGYGLVAGFKTSTLFVGADLVSSYEMIIPKFRSAVKGKFVIPTFSISASNLVYFAQSDIAKEVEAKLKGSYSQFSELSQTLKELDEIELDYAAQRLESLSNAGIVQGPAQVKFEQFKPFHKLDGFGAEMNSKAGWTTFYSVLTKIEDVSNVYASSPRSH